VLRPCPCKAKAHPSTTRNRAPSSQASVAIEMPEGLTGQESPDGPPLLVISSEMLTEERSTTTGHVPTSASWLRHLATAWLALQLFGECSPNQVLPAAPVPSTSGHSVQAVPTSTVTAVAVVPRSRRPEPPKPVESEDNGTCRRVLCPETGQCTLVGERCAASRDDDCQRSRLCAVQGACSLVGDKCGVTRDEDCRASAVCERFGRCTLFDGECSVPAVSNADCRAPHGTQRVSPCQTDSQCVARQGVCQCSCAKDFASCHPSPLCVCTQQGKGRCSICRCNPGDPTCPC
jgi:hypothetical protein